MSVSIYVGNLDFQATEQQLSALFTPFGAVFSARIPVDRETRQPRGFGFVEMEDGDAEQAINALQGTTFLGRTLTVNRARDRAFSSSYGRSPAR